MKTHTDRKENKKKKGKKRKFILWFGKTDMRDVPKVGGKNASLGEMYKNLSKRGVRIPNGFSTTTEAYWHFLKSAGIAKNIRPMVRAIGKNKAAIPKNAKMMRELITSAELPEGLASQIIKAYGKLCDEYGPNTDVAVRSSATAEDMPTASFAGQQETYLNIRGEKALLEAVKKCIASLFTNRAISYRMDKGINGTKVALSVGVQKMVRSDLASSGVMFTVDTETGFKDVVFINAAYGLGEFVVQGIVNPDEYYVFKPTLHKYAPIFNRNMGEKREKLVYNVSSRSTSGSAKPTRKVSVPENERRRYVLSDDEILELARYAVIIEDHYSRQAGKWRPMDIEWAKDGKTGELFIVQARPETVQSQKSKNVLKIYRLKEKGKVILQGDSVGDKIGAGTARIIMNPKKAKSFETGDVIVTDMTDPDWEPLMKRAAAIITERGGRTCHAAIISRELGIPCIIGTNTATKAIKTGRPVTADCSQGEQGYVYEGALGYGVKRVNVKKIPKTRTKVMMNVGMPESALEQAAIPNAGVGLARQEFIITSSIKIHPLALIDYPRIMDKRVKRSIERMTYGYSDKRQFFIDKLAEGIATISAAFYPNDVIMRFSDFKTNEYANLVGGSLYEPIESNPMIGWRGASRYYSDKFREAFELECEAVKKVRNVMGLKNLKVMVPFCRTVSEGKKVLAEMARNGLRRGKDGLEVYVMCEIPSNVILADQFAEIFDGFSIGSNDLTQLTLGLDRDSGLVSSLFDERNEAVKRMVSQVIRTAKKHKRKIGICGQGPSDYPEFARFLVREGIDSISLNPDTVVATTLKIAEEERKARKRYKSKDLKIIIGERKYRSR
jgi:pyruvate,water dikinase